MVLTWLCFAGGNGAEPGQLLLVCVAGRRRQGWDSESGQALAPRVCSVRCSPAHLGSLTPGAVSGGAACLRGAAGAVGAEVQQRQVPAPAGQSPDVSFIGTKVQNSFREARVKCPWGTDVACLGDGGESHSRECPCSAGRPYLGLRFPGCQGCSSGICALSDSNAPSELRNRVGARGQGCGVFMT